MPLLLLFGAAALVLMCGAASASSYSGSGDWTIGAAVNEVVTGENIVVDGNLTVVGRLELVNSTLRMAYNSTPTPPDPPHNGHIFVSGQLFSRNSTITFDVRMEPPTTTPPGFRISGLVVLSNFDNGSATGTRVLASANGTHSVISPGGTLWVINSTMRSLGYQDFAGINANRATIYANGSRFEGAGTFINSSNCQFFFVDNSTFYVDTAISPFPSSTAIFTNGCSDPNVWNSVFDGNSIAWRNIGGTNLTASSNRLANFGVGFAITDTTKVQIVNITANAPIPHVLTLPWLQTGTIIGLVGTGSASVTSINATYGNGTGSRFPGLVLYASLAPSVTLANVMASNIAAIAEVRSSANTRVQNVTATAVDGGLSFYNGNGVQVNDVTINDNPGSALTVWDTPDFRATNVAVNGSLGFDMLRSSRASIDRAVINTTGVGVLYDTGSQFNLTATAIRGAGSGIVISGATTVGVSGMVMEVGNYAVSLILTRNLAISSLSMTSFGTDPTRQLFLASNVTSTMISTVSFDGTCTSAGSFLSADSLTIDGLRVNYCLNGLAIVGGSSLTLRHLDLSRAANGTALSVSGVTGGLVEASDLSGAGGYALSISASSSIIARNLNGTAAGVGGAIVQAGNQIDVQDSAFDNSNGTCFAIINSTGRVTGLRLSAFGCRIGAEVLNSAAAELREVDASSSLLMGIYVDSLSAGAAFYDLTLVGNGLQGIAVDASNVALVDGYIASNGAEGIAPSPGTRLDWQVRGSASFLDGYARMSGYITVYPGGSLDLERAQITFDPFMIVPAGGSWVPFAVEGGGYATMEEATFQSWNVTVPYGIEFQLYSVADIYNCQFNGAARYDAASRVFGSPDWLGIEASTFTGFNRPLDVGGAAIALAQVTFVDNVLAARIRSASVNLTQVVATDSEGHGLEIAGSTSVEAVDVLLSNNSGIGLFVQGVGQFTSWGLQARFNLQGGASFADTNILAYGTIARLNSQYGIYVLRGGTVQFIGLESSTNPGIGLSVSGSSTLLVDDAIFTLNGGTGVILQDVNQARVEDSEISYVATVSMILDGVVNATVERVLFVQASFAHLQVTADTSARFAYCSFLDSPGEAVTIGGTARVTFEQVDGDAGAGGIRASQSSYAHLLNSTFASAPQVEQSAVVDISWFVRVRVLEESGLASPGATVTFTDLAGAAAGESVTGSDGVTPLLPVLMGTYFAAGRVTAFSPHTLNAVAASAGNARGTFNITGYALLTLTLDSTAPTTTLALAGPVGANGWYTGAVTATLEGLDNGTGALTLHWLVPGELWNTTLGPSGRVAVTFTLQAEGTTVLQFYTVDENGNTEAVQSVPVRIDLSGPSAAIVAPPNLPITATHFRMNWSAASGPSGANVTLRIDYSLNGGPYVFWLNWQPNATHPTDGSAMFSAQEGNYTFRAQATDEAGLVSPPAQASVQVRLAGALRITVTGAGEVLEGVTLRVVGANISKTGRGTFYFGLPPGTYQLEISAPGYSTRGLSIEVTPGNDTDLGSVALERSVVNTGAGDATWLIVLVVAAGAAAALIAMKMRKRRPEDPQGPQGPH